MNTIKYKPEQGTIGEYVTRTVSGVVVYPEKIFNELYTQE